MTWSSGGFHNTGQGQVRLFLSSVSVSPSFSPSVFFLPLFCIFFFCLLVCVEGGWHSSHQGGFANTEQGQVSLFSSFFLPLFLFIFLSSSSFVPLSVSFLHFFAGVCGGGLALQWMNFTVKTRIWKSVPWSVCKQNRCIKLHQ